MNQPARLRITRDIYDEIGRTVGHRWAEQGGALGRNEQDDIVRYFRFDHSARRTGATYSPDHDALNDMFRSDWNPRGIRLAGFVHSHPAGFAQPSSGDEAYALRILRAIPDLPYLYLPIVQTVPDTGSFEFRPFVAHRTGDALVVRRVDLEVVDGVADRGEDTGGSIEARAFARVTGAYDLERLAHARVVAVGVGGGASFLEDLARCGVGEFVLIDADVVSETNLATQQVYRRDLGRPKVSALADRIRDINPAARVREIPAPLDDLDDRVVRDLVRSAMGDSPPISTLLCGLTDSFAAQARVNALALHLGTPSLCAQVWAQGRAAEVTFTYPGLTPACHRCVLVTRYNAYLRENFVNTVTSDGTPIFATSRLNALKGYVALALLHYRPDVASVNVRPGARFADLAARMATRNLAIIRLDPDLSESLGFTTFDRVFAGAAQDAILFDETIWRTGTPEPGCPDCGGTGDLAAAQGTFGDTRRIRTVGG